MGGFYSWEETAIDLKRLCERYGVDFYQDNVRAVNRSEKTVITSDGKEFGYDYLVINLGAVTSQSTAHPNFFPVKPMSRLVSLREKLISGSIKNVLIAGAGAAGTEIALNLSHPKSKIKIAGQITLIDLNSRILSTFSEKVSRVAEKILKSRNVIIQTETEFNENRSGYFDVVIVAVGNKAVSKTIEHEFEVNKNGRIAVTSTLLVEGENSVFAAGDTANITGKNFPQIGVHAVKQGVLLRENIELLRKGRTLKKYRPYPVNPLIISDGPDNAISITGKFCVSGKLQSVIKHCVDMKWVEKYRLPSQKRKNGWNYLLTGCIVKITFLKSVLFVKIALRLRIRYLSCLNKRIN